MQENIKILISKEQIQNQIDIYAKKISDKYRGKPLLFVGILNGCFIFMSDFCRKVSIPCEIGFMSVKSYVGTKSSGNVDIKMDLNYDISRYNVVILEDIIDTGRTLKEVYNILKSRNPISLEIVTLLDKPSRRTVDFSADESLFTIDDKFVVGYGLDYNEKYRNLPFIGEIIQEMK
jgi:hypoxanthine phosphoribosyltransferase